MRPWLIGRQVSAIGKSESHGIKRDDQVLVVVHFLERLQHFRLCSDIPNELLVRYGVVQAHAFLRDLRELVSVYR